MLGIRGRCIHDNGAYAALWADPALHRLGPFPGPYALERSTFRSTSSSPTWCRRRRCAAPARPNVAFVLERLADRIARHLELDRAEVRRRSFVAQRAMPYTTGMKARDGSPDTYDSGDYHGCLDPALERVRRFPARQAAARAAGNYLGLGIASYVEDTGLGPYEGAPVAVEPSGKVVITTGAAAQGQGHRTVFAQIAADILGGADRAA